MDRAAPTIANFLNPARSSCTVGYIEEVLEFTDHVEGGFYAVVHEILESPFWHSQNFLDNPYKPLCLVLAKEIDALSISKAEPAYHSRQHLKDVCLMLSCLLMQDQCFSSGQAPENPWESSRKENWLLLLAAIGHDFCHPGLINKAPFEIEKNSLALLEVFFNHAQIDDNLKKSIFTQLSPWIMATDPAAYPALLTKFINQEASHEDCLAMLLVEADLIASVLPVKGQQLGARLGEEWRIANPSRAESVKSSRGRIKFLENLRFMSPHATALRVEQIRLNSISALANLKFRD